jgi:hypothetical protein
MLRFLLVPMALVFLVQQSASAAESRRHITGIYTWGAEVETFYPCDVKKEYWVDTTDAISKKLSSAHQALTSEPYGGVYVEVSGYFAGPAKVKDGDFAANYDGIFKIQRIYRIRKRTPSDCHK